MKTCLKCDTPKDLNEFHKDAKRPDGRFPYCKRCRRKDPDKYDLIKQRQDEGLRWCSACKAWLNPQLFYPNPGRRDGIHHHCQSCCKAQAKVYAAKTSDKRSQREKERWATQKAQRSLAYMTWYTANRDAVIKR